MTWYPTTLTPGTSGGNVTAVVYMAVANLSTIPWQDPPTSATALAIQAEELAKKLHDGH
jgi:hypothetical protein